MAKYLKKPKMNIPMCIAGVLFCLTALSAYLVSGLYASYTTAGTGSDAARVIRFGDITVTQTGDAGNMIIPGVDIDKGIAVSFTGSESATYVFVEVCTGKWTRQDRVFRIGDYLSWEVAEDWTPLAVSGHVFYRELAPKEILSDAPVIRDGRITVSTSVTGAVIGSLADTLSFRASVVQSNGFDSPAAAWASLESKGGGAG